MKFTKMQGAGNDFIIINNLIEHIAPDKLPSLAKMLCQRRFFVGADGLMVVEKARYDGDFAMQFYNSDGSMAEMCGNGARCIARYGFESELSGEHPLIETTAGMVEGWRISETIYKIKLNPPSVVQLDVSAEEDISYIELGNPGIPHALVFCPGLKKMMENGGYREGYLKEQWEILKNNGCKFRHYSTFKKGANINFYEMLGEDVLVLATYERGVEDFTLACGTGAGAAVCLLREKRLVSGKNVRVLSAGGILTVDVEDVEAGKQIYLTGEAVRVFEGEVF